jgi:hypothetical protein
LWKNYLAPLLALGLAAGLLAACSSTQITDMIPTAAGGLPENAPARPAAAPEYPAVNAMPQRREALTDDEVKRTQAEMTALRQQQEQRAAEAAIEPPPAPDPPPPPAKKSVAVKSAPVAAKKTAAAKPAKKTNDAKAAAELTAKDAAK